MYVKLSYSDRQYFLPFFDDFGNKPWLDSLLREALFSACHHKHPEGKKRCFWLADRNEPMQFGYSARISVSRVSPTLAWIFVFVFFVTWCLSTNARIDFKRFLMDQSKKGCYALFLHKTRRVQLLFYFNALSLPNYVRTYSAAKIHSF